MNHKEYMYCHKIGHTHRVTVERLTDKNTLVLLSTMIMIGDRSQFRQSESLLAFNCEPANMANEVNKRQPEAVCVALDAAIPGWRVGTAPAAPSDMDVNLEGPLVPEPVVTEPTPEPIPEPVTAEETAEVVETPKKRKRRSKEEIAAVKAAKAEATPKREIPTESFDRTNHNHRALVAQVGFRIWPDFKTNANALGIIREITTELTDKGVAVPLEGELASGFVKVLLERIEKKLPEFDQAKDIALQLKDLVVGAK